MRVILVARKPMVISIVHSVLDVGTGSFNIDLSRIGFSSVSEMKTHAKEWDRTFETSPIHPFDLHTQNHPGAIKIELPNNHSSGGRWPPNLILEHLSSCSKDGTMVSKATSCHGEHTAIRKGGVHITAGGHQKAGRETPVKGYGDPDGNEEIEKWDCTDHCPVSQFDILSGDRPGMSGGGAKDNVKKDTWVIQQYNRQVIKPEWLRKDTGGASRFFKQFKDSL